ncbi:MFS transporter [uncultured Lactobacillus sp.]|uniref:MFS transporter n=1 Tax=uncultured Lactobacillus sp. TaxID=153152 RepID=UPI00266505E5|nr:MFS transporter [uncultured Lactobacillus sp.]
MKDSKFKKVMLIVSLLALNIVEQAASVISATIPQMAKSFPGHSQVQIELITTIVSMFVTIFVLVSGLIVNKLGQKTTAVLGIAIAAVSSIIPAFSNSFNMIMVSRAILGVGIGLANPLAVSLIGEFFEGDFLAHLMGWRAAASGIGTSLMTLLAGQLLKISWHAAYLVYLLFVPTLIFFIFFVPDPEKAGIKKEAATENDQAAPAEETAEKHARAKVVFYAAVLFAYFSSVMVGMVKLATMYVENGVGTPSQASTVFACLNFAQLLGGLVFGLLYKFLKSKILPLGILLSGLTLVGMAMTTSNSAMIALGIASGFCGGASIPYIFTRVSQLSVTKTAPMNNALVLVGSNIGSFLAPYTASLLGKTAATSIRNAGFALIVISVIVLVSLLAAEKSKPDHALANK